MRSPIVAPNPTMETENMSDQSDPLSRPVKMSYMGVRSPEESVSAPRGIGPAERGEKLNVGAMMDGNEMFDRTTSGYHLPPQNSAAFGGGCTSYVQMIGPVAGQSWV